MTIHKSGGSTTADIAGNSEVDRQSKPDRLLKRHVEKKAELWSSMTSEEALEEPFADLSVYLNEDGTVCEFVLLLEPDNPTIELLVMGGVLRGYSEEGGTYTAPVENKYVLKALRRRCITNFSAVSI